MKHQGMEHFPVFVHVTVSLIMQTLYSLDFLVYRLFLAFKILFMRMWEGKQVYTHIYFSIILQKVASFHLVGHIYGITCKPLCNYCNILCNSITQAKSTYTLNNSSVIDLCVYAYYLLCS